MKIIKNNNPLDFKNFRNHTHDFLNINKILLPINKYKKKFIQIITIFIIKINILFIL